MPQQTGSRTSHSMRRNDSLDRSASDMDFTLSVKQPVVDVVLRAFVAIHHQLGQGNRAAKPLK
jgi:hypothetical protein